MRRTIGYNGYGKAVPRDLPDISLVDSQQCSSCTHSFPKDQLSYYTNETIISRGWNRVGVETKPDDDITGRGHYKAREQAFCDFCEEKLNVKVEQKKEKDLEGKLD